MWSFPQKPPSDRFSRGALAIIPAMFVGFALWEGLLLGKWRVMFEAYGVFLVPVWLGIATAWIASMIQRRRLPLIELFAFVAYCALACLWLVYLFQ